MVMYDKRERNGRVLLSIVLRGGYRNTHPDMKVKKGSCSALPLFMTHFCRPIFGLPLPRTLTQLRVSGKCLFH